MKSESGSWRRISKGSSVFDTERQSPKNTVRTANDIHQVIKRWIDKEMIRGKEQQAKNVNKSRNSGR